MDWSTLFQIIKEELLNHTDLEEELVEEIADSITERLLEESVFDQPSKEFADD